MATSRFLSTRPVKVTPPKEGSKVKENFAGGLDTLTSLDLMAENRTPYTRNCRNVHQGSLGKRKGPTALSVPGGQAADQSKTTVTGATNLTLSTTTYQASSFVAGSTSSLTRVDLNLKMGPTAATAPVVVEIWTNSSGAPGVKIASSSISVAAIGSSLTYLPARFIEAPTLASGATYWVVAYVQSNGTGTALWSASSAYATGLTSTNSGSGYTASNGTNFITYMSTSGAVLGRIRVRFSSGLKYLVFARKEAGGTTGVYYANETTGVITAIKTGLSASATAYSFVFANNVLYYVNGFDAPRQWDGSNEQALSGFPTSPFIPFIVCLHKNRLWFLDNTSRVVFSDIGAFSTYQTVSFVYVPSPLPKDPVTVMVEFQDNLVFGNRSGKYVLYGSDLSSFVMRQSLATKGMTSQQTSFVDGNYLYFWSTDGQIYQSNGTTDTMLSEPIMPTLQALTNLTTPFLIVWQNQIRFYFAEPGQAQNNAMLSYDLINPGWFYDDYAYISGAMIRSATGDALDLVEDSSMVGALYLAEQGYNNLGRAIRAEYWDKPDNFGQPGVTKQILFYYPKFAGQSVNSVVDCQVDKELQNSPISNPQNMQGTGALWGAAVWGSFVWGTQALVEPTIPVSGLWHYFQNRWVCDGADTPFELRGYSTYYLMNQPY